MKKKVMVLNGPNLNFLGTREPEIYGYDTLAMVEERLHKLAKKHGLEVDFRQSNWEGELVTWIQEARSTCAGVVINPAAYTHTSVAIRDAFAMCDFPIVEIHLSHNPQREAFRHTSYVSLVANGVMMGFGAHGYELAFEAVARLIKDGSHTAKAKAAKKKAGKA